jgi:hypothetical protein
VTSAYKTFISCKFPELRVSLGKRRKKYELTEHYLRYFGEMDLKK